MPPLPLPCYAPGREERYGYSIVAALHALLCAFAPTRGSVGSVSLQIVLRHRNCNVTDKWKTNLPGWNETQRVRKSLVPNKYTRACRKHDFTRASPILQLTKSVRALPGRGSGCALRFFVTRNRKRRWARLTWGGVFGRKKRSVRKTEIRAPFATAVRGDRKQKKRRKRRDEDDSVGNKTVNAQKVSTEAIRRRWKVTKKTKNTRTNDDSKKRDRRIPFNSCDKPPESEKCAIRPCRCIFCALFLRCRSFFVQNAANRFVCHDANEPVSLHVVRRV